MTRLTERNKNMEREDALAFWDAIFGKDVKWHVDCFGTWMYREDYGDTSTTRKRPNGDGKEHSYGWEIDHIRPKSNFKKESDANFLNNFEPMWWNYNREKADNYPHFIVNNKEYKVVKCDICAEQGLLGYGIADKNGHRVDWKAKQKKYFV